MKKALLALAAVVVVAAVAIGSWIAFGGESDVETRGTCGGNAYELAVEEEDGGLDVTFELQAAAPGETWTVLVEQDGNTLLEGERTTDEDAELDLDAPANGDEGDEFTVTATPTTGEPCTATVTR
jgi:hypothetical protein